MQDIQEIIIQAKSNEQDHQSNLIVGNVDYALDSNGKSPGTEGQNNIEDISNQIQRICTEASVDLNKEEARDQTKGTGGVLLNKTIILSQYGSDVVESILDQERASQVNDLPS